MRIIRKFGSYLSVILFIIAFFGTTATAAEDQPIKILILPFTIHADKDVSYLKAAVSDMLYTRLSAEDRLITLETDPSGPLTPSEAVTLGQEKGADYVLSGSITLLGAMVSTDAQFIGMNDQKPLVTFNQTGKSQGEIIAHIDSLASQINDEAFDFSAAETPPSSSAGKTDDIHIHPEKMVIPGMQPPSPPPSAPPAAPEPEVVIAPQPDPDKVRLSYWKSDNFSEDIQGISIGDVDGDQRNETVFIGVTHIYVYRYDNNRLQEFKTFSEKSFTRLIRLDMADINQNGRDEIYVTDYISSQNRITSIVLEWNGKKLDIIGEKADWYLRVLKTSGSEPLLLGQKHGLSTGYSSIKEAVFDWEVHVMKWEDGDYKPASLYTLPAGMSLYDFTCADASNNGRDEIVAFSWNDHIVVYDPDGEVAWKSNESYGGNRLFIKVPEPDDVRKETNYYLPQRIHVADIDMDGLNEIIVVKNHDTTRILSRIKAFNEGYIECMSYDDIGTQLKWQTRKISGYISDYVIGDLNNDGRNEIVFSAVTKKKSLLSKGKSFLMTCTPFK